MVEKSLMIHGNSGYAGTKTSGDCEVMSWSLEISIVGEISLLHIVF